MNSKYYHALKRTGQFFDLFDHIKYKHVPVVRAMAHSFHKNAMKYSTSNIPNSNMKKGNLYSILIRNESVTHIHYQPISNTRPKLIFSPFAHEGLGVNISKHFVFSSKDQNNTTPMILDNVNKSSYRSIMNQIGTLTRKQEVPNYFKTRKFLLWISSQLKMILRMIDAIENLLNRNRIAGIIQYSSVHSLGYLLVHMGKQRRIPTINMQVGLNNDYQLFSMYADDYICFGRSHRNRLTKFGVPINKFNLLGSAKINKNTREKWVCKQQLSRRLRFPMSNKVFVYAEQPTDALLNKKVMKSIIKSIQPYKNQITLVVKEHPRQNKKTITSKWIKKHPFIRRVSGKGIKIYHLIRNADAVFVQFSTVGLESMLFKKPVVSICFNNNTIKFEYNYYSKSKFVTSARTDIQLNAIVKQLMKSGSYRTNIIRKQQMYLASAYSGGNSTSRIKAFIRSKTGVNL